MQSGAQCVMTSGALKTLKWFADSWDMNQQVCLNTIGRKLLKHNYRERINCVYPKLLLYN